MKNILWFLVVFLVSCSIDKTERLVVIDNPNGLSTLVNVTDIGESEECANGGVRLDFGLDVNDNGELDFEEIQTTAFVCNGIDGEDGLSSLTNLVPISGEESSCENGGVIVQTGFDLNGNGLLDPEEVLSSTYVCNGTNGTDGTNGQDGYNSLINSTVVEPSDEFPNGGVLISVGLDLDFDGILSDDEITQVTFISNGIDGQDGVDGVDGQDGVDGIGVTITTEETEGGYWIYFWEGDEIINQIFISNGVDGIDGIDGEDGASVDVTTEQVEGGYIITFTQNGIVVSQVFIANGTDGIDGIDGLDGTSTTITTEDVEGGYWIYFWEGDEIVNQIFVANGTDGIDGTDGQDGEDGTSTTVTTEETEGGYWIYFWEGDTIVSQIFVANGTDGIDGINGTNGTDGTNGLNNLINLLPNTPSNGQTTIEVGLDINANGILESNEVLNSTVINDGQDGTDGTNGLTSYIFVTELEAGDICETGGLEITYGLDLNGNGELDEDEATVEYICCDYCCNETYTICVKCPNNQCHWNWDTLVLDNIVDYNFYMGIYDEVNEGHYYIYHHQSFDTPEGYSCDDFDCDSTPNYN